MITILIQGPLRNNLCLNTLQSYLKYGKVLLVVYKNDDTTEIEVKFPSVTVVKIDYPDVTNKYNFNNTFVQTNGILEGLKLIDTEFTIRVRSDESFPDLTKFIENIKNNPNKIHVSNLYSFKDEVVKFHMGNHIFAGKTDILLKAFEWAYNVCTNSIENVTIQNDDMYFLDKMGIEIKMWSEILQTISYLIGLGVDISSKNSKNIMLEHFFMTPLADFPNFKWTHKYTNYGEITESTQMEYDPTWTNSGHSPNRFMLKIEDI